MTRRAVASCGDSTTRRRLGAGPRRCGVARVRSAGGTGAGRPSPCGRAVASELQRTDRSGAVCARDHEGEGLSIRSRASSGLPSAGRGVRRSGEVPGLACAAREARRGAFSVRRRTTSRPNARAARVTGRRVPPRTLNPDQHWAGCSFRDPVASWISKRLYRHISQDVCPWNPKFAVELAGDSAFRAREFIARKDALTLATDILALDQEQFSAAFRKSPMKRAGLRWHATVVLANVVRQQRPSQTREARSPSVHVPAPSVHVPGEAAAAPSRASPPTVEAD